MSSMAKIFVVVNLILGVVAFGSAATLLGAKEDYKAANADMAKKFEAYQASATAERDTLNRDVAAQKGVTTTAVAAKTAADQSNEDLKGQLTRAESANGKHMATIEQQTNQIKALTEVNKSYKDWLDRFAGEAKTSTQDKLNFQTKWQKEVNNRVNLENQVSKAREEISALAATNGDLDKKRRNAEFWLNKYREKYGDITGGPKGANGVVKSVKGNLVVVSVGSDDKVANGDTYQLRRGSAYVGQITITTVYKDAAVGVFDTQFKGPGAPPQAGDVAEARGYGG